MKKGFFKKTLSMVICSVFIAAAVFSTSPAHAAQKTLLLSQAKSMALANSDSYRRIKSRIALKEVSYKQAVKSIQLKIKNKTTFRWSPLLSFKFPEKLNFEDSSSMVYKPAQILNEITQLKHELTDEIFSVYEETEQEFLEVYTYQQLVGFEEEQLEGLRNTLDKNKGRLILGLADKADVEAIEKSITAAEEKLAQDMKIFENAKEKLSDIINIDVSTRYTFEDPYIEAEIPRSQLDAFIDYTLANDQSYYEAKMNTQLSLLQLEANYSLLKSQYGSDINLISNYVQQVLNGMKIDSAAFKTSYDKFLTKIDKPWQGSWRILFIKIPKEWLKGQIDGVRYIEDEPYALYENALEYQDTLADQIALEKELRTQVKDSYEAVVNARSAYLKLDVQVEEAKEQLKKEQVLNALGELTFEEYTESQKQYEELQIEAASALESYNSLLFSFDRLTCGAVSKYFNDNRAALTAGSGGNSYIVDEEDADGAKYYIQSIVEDNMFEFGIYLPDDFETDITHYELWVDNYIVGERTEIDKTIRHLTLSLTGEEKVFVRLYNDEEFVDDCEIDPTAYQGPLDVTGYVVRKADGKGKRVIGSYEMKTLSEMGLVEIKFAIDGVEDIHFYSVKNENDISLLSKDKIGINDSFKYMDFLHNDMISLKMVCFDADGNEKYTAFFDVATRSIYVIEE